MKPIGYLWLKERYSIETLEYWVTSFVRDKGAAKTEITDGRVRELLRAGSWPGDHWTAHLEFALKREGLHLELLRKLCPLLPVEEVLDYIKATPTGRYARITWYLYEGLAGQPLELENLSTGNYVSLLDPKIYLTATPRKVARQRIDVNLLGNLEFTPMVRLSEIHFVDENAQLKAECQQAIEAFPASLYQRAVRYLYSKESKSSHEIENETPTAQRTQRFVALLEQAWQRDFLNKEALIEIQNTIVDPRFQNDGYRDLLDEQIYVGESLGIGHERIHYIGPKPADTPVLMQPFLAVAKQMLADPAIPDLVASALIAYLFNFIHPFSDGNGRIHRFLMHHSLAQRKFGKQGIVLPISATILNQAQDYDRSLESFSRKLLEHIDYELDESLRMTVHGDTIDFYRYIDATELTEIFYQFARETIRLALPAEVDHLMRHDQCRAQMRDVVDLPDRYAELFIRLCQQNAGSLSKRKRSLQEFAELSEEEITSLQAVVQQCFQLAK